MEIAPTSGLNAERFPNREGSERQNWPAVESIVSKIENLLFPPNPDQSPSWLDKVADGLPEVFRRGDVYDEFVRWRKMAMADALTPPGQTPAGCCTPNDCRSERCKLLGDIEQPDSKTARAVLRCGLQYVVLAFQPGSQDFRGAFVRSHLVDPIQAEAVRQSLRVPRRRGAVNWMKDFSKDPSNPVVTIFDAWLDLRGRAAAEDLILGNRSVAGFPVYLFGGQGLAGFFFVSHPIPGLFYQKTADGTLCYSQQLDFLHVMKQVRKEFETELASAIDMDMLAGFAEQSRPFRHTAGLPLSVSRRESAPLIDLSSEGPAGYMATLLFQAGAATAKCDINEDVFVSQLWSLLGLLSFFPDSWQHPVVHRMHALASSIEMGADAGSSRWESQGREEDGHTAEGSVAAYYPSEIKQPRIELWAASTKPPQTELHARIESCMDLYSTRSEHGQQKYPQGDLIVPLVCPEGYESPAPKVIGILRFNCDHHLVDDPPAAHQRLYSLISARKDELDNALGRLLALADQDVQRIIKKRSADLFKQAVDAVRLLADWCTNRLVLSSAELKESGVNDDKDQQRHSVPSPQENLLEYAFLYVWNRLVDLDILTPNGRKLRSDLLETVRIVVSGLAHDISIQSNLPITLVTFWLRIWMPRIEHITGDEKAFSSLVVSDPGLPEVLRHLVCTSEWNNFQPENLCNKKIEVAAEDGHAVDFGFPSADANLSSLLVERLGECEIQLHWAKKVPEQETHTVCLSWAVDPGADACSCLLPASMAFVRARVSERVGRVITAAGEVSLTGLNSGLQNEIAIERSLFPPKGALTESVVHLETAFVDRIPGHPPKTNAWTVLPLSRSDADKSPAGHLCVLAPNYHGRTIVTATRDLTLSNALARFRAERFERERGFLLQKAAIGHGFRGPAEQLKDGITMVLGSLKRHGDAPKEVIGQMERLRSQAIALGELASDAVEFANSFFGAPSINTRNGSDLVADLKSVVAAVQNPLNPTVAESYPRDKELTGICLHYAQSLFRHTIAKLLENAIRSQSGAETVSTTAEINVSISLAYTSSHVFVRVTNAASNPVAAVEAMETALRGTTPGHLGLNEARICCDLSGIELRVDRSLVNKGCVGVEIALPIGRGK